MTGSTTPWAAAAHHIAVRAFGWLNAATEHFALPADASLELDINKHIKPLSELALAGSIAVREGATGSRETRLAPALDG